MYPAITVTFAQFQHALEEWLTRRQIYQHTSDILSLYAHGIEVNLAASIIIQMIADGR